MGRRTDLNLKNILLILVFLLALFLRTYKLGQVPPSLYWDEAAMALDAKSIDQTGKDQHGNFWFQPIYPSWGDYKLPGYILTASPFFKLIKNSPEIAIRLPSALAGTLTVLIIYFLTKELFKNILKPPILNLVSLTASFLLAISPWHLQFSRAAFEASLALLFNLLAILFFLKSSNKKIWLIFSLMFAVFGVYTYYSSRIVLPLLLFLSFLFFWKKSLKNILSFILVLCLVGLTALPLKFSLLALQSEQFRLSAKNILNDSEIINYSNQLIKQDNNNFIAKKIHHRFIYRTKILASQLFDHLSLNFLVLTGDNNLRHSTTKVGELLFVAFIGLIYGEYLLFRTNKKIFYFLNISLLTSFLPASVPYEVPHALRSLNAVIFINIIAAFGLIQLISAQGGSASGGKLLTNKKLLLFTVCCLLFTQFFFYLHDYYIHYPSRSFFAWQGGYKQAVWEVNQEYDKAEKIIFTDFYARPYIYFLLYSGYPINNFQTKRQELLVNNPLNYLETNKIDKIGFRRVNFREDQKIEKVLLIGSPEEIPEGLSIDNISTFVLWKNY